MNGYWHDIEFHLSEIERRTLQFVKKEPLSGGCINQAWKVTDTQNKHWFIKTNSAEQLAMFKAEAEGLNEIKASNSIHTPQVIASGKTANSSYLILKYIPLQSQINQKTTGKQLAKLHQFHNPNKQFGWKRNNTIGSTPQLNTPNNCWITFWKNERLLYQLNLAKDKGYSNKAYEMGLKLAENASLLFSDYQPQPSLLHGDLWAGNCGSDRESNPVIYDPAVYYGDREADIAMTELFGGFTADFYKVYNEIYPLDPDYKVRKILYNLYHILNHYNLFGGSYASQATSMIEKLLSEI